ncbi:MAG: hypothetical protein IPL78_00140 [Chloroflexi bacterium]|nr:hypothetical protein [Chloroflexota bacterium]
MKRFLIFLTFVLLVALAFWLGQRGDEDAAAAAPSLISQLAQPNTAGFAQALEPGVMEFPRDLGPHPEYQTEWWYYTGNLQTAEGRQFGYQLTFFRSALVPENQFEAGVDGSDWRTNQVYLAHFTISDIAEGQFYAEEQFSRGAAALAGAQAEPYHIWLNKWQAEEVGPGQVRLLAQGEMTTLELMVTETRPRVLHGDEGLSAKGGAPGNASYYYSLIGLDSAGTITVNGESFAVTGESWKDHEYSTSALSEGSVGWDWYSIQLDNDYALMFFQIRREDGTLEPFSSGSWIDPQGNVTPLTLADWQMEPLDSWTSPTSGAEYPIGWRITLDTIGLELEGSALMPNQELNVSTIYWEGASAFTGTLNGEPVTALGYVEMTGYAR